MKEEQWQKVRGGVSVKLLHRQLSQAGDTKAGLSVTVQTAHWNLSWREEP